MRPTVGKCEEESKKYLSTHSVVPSYTGSYGFCVLPVLPYLIGRRWDDIALAFVSSLKPESIRVTQGETKTDAITGRVTIYVDQNYLIQEIFQEASVWLPDGVEHGDDLMSRIDGVK